MAAWIKMSLGMELGLGHNFRPISCGHMAAWIKMSLGMELGLGQGDVVLDGDPLPLPKR